MWCVPPRCDLLAERGAASRRRLPGLFGSRLSRALVLRVEVLLERRTEVFVLVLVLTRKARAVAQHPLFHRVDRLLRVGLRIVRSLGIIRLRPNFVVCPFVIGHDSPFVGKFRYGCRDGIGAGNDGDPDDGDASPHLHRSPSTLQGFQAGRSMLPSVTVHHRTGRQPEPAASG
jgi:hypothetical protein